MAILTAFQDPIGSIILDRPEKANAYDRAHLQALEQALCAAEARCKVLIIASTGTRAFCAGADLSELAAADPLDALDLYSQKVFNRLAASPCITIAAIQGPAVAGGCELALACDLRVVGPHASFRLPETSLGLIPAAGGTTRLTRLLGASRAKQVILLGRTISATQAVEWGLAAELADDPTHAAQTLATTLASRDHTAMRLAKHLIDADESATSLLSERIAEALLYSRKSN